MDRKLPGFVDRLAESMRTGGMATPERAPPIVYLEDSDSPKIDVREGG
jgi:hypothetical protein